jgi:hypothetical protein
MFIALQWLLTVHLLAKAGDLKSSVEINHKCRQRQEWSIVFFSPLC